MRCRRHGSIKCATCHTQKFTWSLCHSTGSLTDQYENTLHLNFIASLLEFVAHGRSQATTKIYLWPKAHFARSWSRSRWNIFSGVGDVAQCTDAQSWSRSRPGISFGSETGAGAEMLTQNHSRSQLKCVRLRNPGLKMPSQIHSYRYVLCR